MSEFMNDPVVTLATQDDLREAIKQPRNACCGCTSMFIYRIKSLWLISLIDEIAASGEYPYNATVKKLAEERLGMPPKSHSEYAREGDTLSLLIYNAQGYRRSDQLINAGYVPFSREILESAYQAGQQLELFSEGLMGSSKILLNVRKIGDELYAMRPKKRKSHIPPHGQPVRLVA